MTNARRLLSVGAFLGIAAVVSFSHGQSGRPTPPSAEAPGYLSTPAQMRANDKSHEESRFAKGGVFTYRPNKEEQLFAVALQPGLPASAVKGRDYLVMVSLSATQAGEGWLASTRIAETLVEMAGDNDRISLWTIGAPKVTKSLLPEADGFLSPKNPDHLKKLKAALAKLKENYYPAGDTDLNESMRALQRRSVRRGRITPRTSFARPFNRIFLPTMAGSPPNRLCQSR
jgi:hypothetical protein